VSGRWLLLRRAETVWAVPSKLVVAVHRRAGGAAVELRGSSSLHAEELLEIASALELRPVPGCLPSPPGAVAALAVWRGEPVLCLDPAGPLPPVLLDSRMLRASPTSALASGELEDSDGRRPREQNRTVRGPGH
jgi:hypothetical protein